MQLRKSLSKQNFLDIFSKNFNQIFFACSHKVALVTASRNYEKKFLSRSILEKMSKTFCLESDFLSYMIRAFVKQLNDRIFFSLTFSFLPQISKSLCPTFAKSSYCYGGDFFTSIEQIKTLTTKIVIDDVSILKSDHVQKRDKKCVCEKTPYVDF